MGLNDNIQINLLFKGDSEDIESFKKNMLKIINYDKDHGDNLFDNFEIIENANAMHLFVKNTRLQDQIIYKFKNYVFELIESLSLNFFFDININYDLLEKNFVLLLYSRNKLLEENNIYIVCYDIKDLKKFNILVKTYYKYIDAKKGLFNYIGNDEKKIIKLKYFVDKYYILLKNRIKRHPALVENYKL